MTLFVACTELYLKCHRQSHSRWELDPAGSDNVSHISGVRVFEQPTVTFDSPPVRLDNLSEVQTLSHTKVGSPPTPPNLHWQHTKQFLRNYDPCDNSKLVTAAGKALANNVQAPVALTLLSFGLFAVV